MLFLLSLAQRVILAVLALVPCALSGAQTVPDKAQVSSIDCVYKGLTATQLAKVDNYQHQVGNFADNLEAYNVLKKSTSTCVAEHGWSDRQRFAAFAYVVLTINGDRARAAYRAEKMPAGLPEELFGALTTEDHIDLSQGRMTANILSVLKSRLFAGYPQILTLPLEDTKRKSATLGALLTSLELDVDIKRMFIDQSYDSPLLNQMMAGYKP